MSKLKIKGRIYYPPGPWGATKPVANARITITDIDLPGKTNDKIFTDTTDSQGRFRGLSDEWQDTTRAKYWKVDSMVPPSGHWAYQTQPDLTDIMILMVKIEADGKEITAPFPFAGDDVEIPLLVVWGPDSSPAWGTVNGVEFTDFQKLIDKFIATIEIKAPIELKLYGGWSDAVAPLVELIQKPPLELAQDVFPGSRPGSIILAIGGCILTISAVEIAALAILVLAIGGLILLTGAAVFITALGVAVILAIVAGYCDISATQATTTDSNGNPTNVTGISLKNLGC